MSIKTSKNRCSTGAAHASAMKRIRKRCPLGKNLMENSRCVSLGAKRLVVTYDKKDVGRLLKWCQYRWYCSWLGI